MSKTPRFTDAAKHSRPYVSAEASKRPNYLRAKFARIKAEQAANAAEAQQVVRPLKKALGK